MCEYRLQIAITSNGSSCFASTGKLFGKSCIGMITASSDQRWLPCRDQLKSNSSKQVTGPSTFIKERVCCLGITFANGRHVRSVSPEAKKKNRTVGEEFRLSD
jgi:hypothetical protein